MSGDIFTVLPTFTFLRNPARSFVFSYHTSAALEINIFHTHGLENQLESGKFYYAVIIPHKPSDFLSPSVTHRL